MKNSETKIHPFDPKNPPIRKRRHPLFWFVWTLGTLAYGLSIAVSIIECNYWWIPLTVLFIAHALVGVFFIKYGNGIITIIEALDHYTPKDPPAPDPFKKEDDKIGIII